MWGENELNNVEFVAEPTDFRIVSAVDPSTIGHQEGWRSEVIGWNPEPVRVISRPRRNKQRIANAGILMIILVS